MKCTLIVDSFGPNPEYDPPKPSDFAGNMEAHADAWFAYAVPREVIVPAGTLLSGHECWMHCVPDSSGVGFDARGRPVRYAPAVIRAVPADDACQMAVDQHVAHVALSHNRTPDDVRAEIASLVKASRACQVKNDAAKKALAAAPVAANN